MFQGNFVLYEAEQLLHNLTQVHIRQAIATINSENLNNQRHEILSTVSVELCDRLNNSGIEIQQLILRDITFPKIIQDQLAKLLEAKIRAKSDLENARTAVATARTLKNAADLVKDNDSIKFFQYLETLAKIASTGKHTFVIGDLNTHGSAQSNRLKNSP